VTALPAALHGRTMKVFVRDLILPCRIGVYSHEKNSEQRVRINLVETLADRIAAQCLADRRVLSATVRVEKLDVMPDAGAVGVEIERHRINR
jgi:dihydroneopterin aldolase